MRMAGVGGLALAILLSATGCTTIYGRPIGEVVDDKATSAKVRLKLVSRLPAATLTRVHVDTYEGTVYLSGAADSEEMKGRIERVAATVDDVGQVVNNLSVRQPAAAAGASADSSGAAGSDYAAASPGRDETLNGVTEQFPGIHRYAPDGGPGGPYAGYDRNGRLVATVYLVPMRGLAQKGPDDFRSGDRHIDHVTIYPVDVQPDVPEARYAIVLWHVSAAEAAALR
jgi:BON domain